MKAIGSDNALSLMCGVRFEDCNISQWLRFMGTYNEDIGVPFTISFQTEENSNFSAPPTRIYSCNESVSKGKLSCSCQDCQKACRAESDYPFIVQVLFFNFRCIFMGIMESK